MELPFKHFVKRGIFWFLLLFFSTPFKFVQGATQMPSHACVGEDITIDCDLSVPDPNNNFRTNLIEFVVGSVDGAVSDNFVNSGTGDHGGVDLSRLTAFPNTSFSGDKIIRGSITLSSYTTSDAGIRLGCSAVYFLSGSSPPIDTVNQITLLTPAAPPSPPSMLSISSNIDPNTCSATVSLNWIPPSSTNRTVDRYYLSLQNGTTLDSIAAPANSYSHNTILLLDTVYAYSVSASSCAGNSTVVTSYLGPIQKAPPAPINLLSSVSNFNTANCSADISLSWNTPPSNIPINRYFLYLDGSLLATTNSNSSIYFTNLNINTDYQYSVTAMSCAGNSTTSSSNVNSVKSFSLMRSSQYVCLAYDNVTGGLTVNWGLSTPTQPSGVSGLDISYSLQLLYSRSRPNVTYTYTDSTNFTLPSSQLSYNTVLTARNFTQLDEVEATNITANLTIVQQCGQSFSGTAMECLFDSNNPPIPPTTPSTNITDSTVPVIPTNSIGAIVGGVVGGCLLLIIIIIILIILAICISFFRKGTNESHKPTHFGMEECDSPTHKGPDQYSKTAETNTNEELNYAQIDHSMSKGSAVRPPAIPSTNYADIGSFPESTHYTTVNEPN